MAHQEAVAGAQPLAGAVQVGEDSRVAPVHYVKDDALAAAFQVFGLEDGKVGGAVGPAGGVAGGQLQVGDDFVGRMLRVNGQVYDAVNPAVGAGVVENGPAGKGLDGVDFQSGNGH